MEVNETGEINYYLDNLINWNIPRFHDISQKKKFRLWSPKFFCVNEERNFVLLPDDQDHGNLILTSSANDGHPSLFIRVGVTDESGKEIEVCQCAWNDCNKTYEVVLTKTADEFERRLKDTNPNAFLRLFCEIFPRTGKETANAATQTEAEAGENKLKQDLEGLFISEKNSDLIIKVKHRKFNVHRNILRARSSVFDSMLSHDLTETTEGFINIEDCEPEIFEVFLLFVYSGKEENVTSDNVCGLYYLADKYNMLDLKEKCISYIKRNFSVGNICDVISLAILHSEVELLKLATDYFAKNVDEILVTCNWLQFVKDNPVEANELYIKSLKLGYAKKA